MWSGMSAFEEGEAETPPAGVIIVDPFCDYLGRRCQKILEEAGYAVVQVGARYEVEVNARLTNRVRASRTYGRVRVFLCAQCRH